MQKKVGVTVFVLYALSIAYVSLLPAESAVAVSYDKAAHLITYAVFAFVAYGLALPRSRYLSVCCGIVVYGGLIEFGQSFVPGRDMSSLDLLANTVGVALGALLVMWYFNRRRL